ncbi:uncharacterized protein PF3D7_1120600-like [Artemia franciscana]|uniref:uncharacterized protein PF3D7_1120600-like n=1 Tax=Artemia franciscana TaxID=6661 RepID=UPI0032DA8A09
MGTTFIRNCITLCLFTIVFGDSRNQNIDEKDRKGKQRFFGYNPYPYYVRRPSYAVPIQPFYAPYQRSPYYSPTGYPFRGFSQFLPFRSNPPIIRVASPSYAPVPVISPQIFPLRRGDESLVAVDSNLDNGASNKLNNYATVLSAVSMEDDEKNINKTNELLHLLVHRPYTGSVEVDHPIEPPKVETIYDSLKEQFSNEKNPLQNTNDENTEVESPQGNESKDISYEPADIFVKYQQDNTLHAAENHKINEALFDTEKENSGSDDTLTISQSNSSDDIQDDKEETDQDNIYTNDVQSIEENQDDNGSLSSSDNLNNPKAEDEEASGVEIIALVPKISSDMEVRPLDALELPSQVGSNEEQSDTKYTHLSDADSIKENQHKNEELQAFTDVTNSNVEDEESSQVETKAIGPGTIFDEEKQHLDRSDTMHQMHEDEQGTQIEIMALVPNAAFDKQKNPLIVKKKVLNDGSDLNTHKNIVSSNLNVQNEDIDKIQIHIADSTSVGGMEPAKSSEASQKEILPTLTEHNSDGTVIKQDDVGNNLEEEPIEIHDGESSEFKVENEQKEFSALPEMTISNQEGHVVADVTVVSEYNNENMSIKDTTGNDDNQSIETRDSEGSEIKKGNGETNIFGQPASSIISYENEETTVADVAILSDSNNQKITKEDTTGNDSNDESIQIRGTVTKQDAIENSQDEDPIEMQDSDSISLKVENEQKEFSTQPESTISNQESKIVADDRIFSEQNNENVMIEDTNGNSKDDQPIETRDSEANENRMGNEEANLSGQLASSIINYENEEKIVADVAILSDSNNQKITKEDTTGNDSNDESIQMHGTLTKQDTIENSQDEEPIEMQDSDSSSLKVENEQKEFSEQPESPISNQESQIVADDRIFSEQYDEKVTIERNRGSSNDDQPIETRDSEASEIKIGKEEANILGQSASSIISHENGEKIVANGVILSDSSNQKISKEGTTGNDPNDEPIQMDDSDSSNSKLENEPMNLLAQPTSSVLNKQNGEGAVADVTIVSEIDDRIMEKEDTPENSHTDETVEIHDFDSSDSKIENEQKKPLVQPMTADLNQEQITADVTISSNGQTKIITKEDITGNNHDEEPAEIHDSVSNDAKIKNEQANVLAPIAPIVVNQDEEAKIVTGVQLLSDSNNGKVTKVGTMETDHYEQKNEVQVRDVTDSMTDNEEKINSLQPILSVLNQESEGTIVKDVTIISNNPIHFGSSIPDDNILDKKDDEISKQNGQHFPTNHHEIENGNQNGETIQDLVFDQHQKIEDNVSHRENNVTPKDNSEVFNNESGETEKGTSNINDQVYNLQSFDSTNLAGQDNTKDILQQDNTIKILHNVLDEQNDPENADEKETESYGSANLDEIQDTKTVPSQVGQNNISEEPSIMDQKIYNIGFDLANKDLNIVTSQDDVFADGDELESIEDDWSAFRGLLEDPEDSETATQSSFNYEKEKILNDGSNSDSSFTGNGNSLSNKESPIVLANEADSHEPPISTSTELSNTLLNMLKNLKEHQYEKVAGDYSSVNILENMIAEVRGEMSNLEQLYSTLTAIELSGNVLFDSEQDELLDDKLKGRDNRLEELNSIYTKYAENLKAENLNEHKETVLAMLRFYSNGVAMLGRMKEGLKPKESSIVVKEAATLKDSDSDQIGFQETNKKVENPVGEFLLNELKNIQMNQINNVAGEYTTSEGLEKMIDSVSKERNDLVNLFSLLVKISSGGNTLEPERMSDEEISPQLYQSQIDKASSFIRRYSSQLNEANLDTHKSYVLSMITRDDNFLEDLFRMKTNAKSNNLPLPTDEIINMDQATFENSNSLQDSENNSATEIPPMFPFPEDELVIIPTVNEKKNETEYRIVGDIPKSTSNLLPVSELVNEETLEANSEDQGPLKSSNLAHSMGEVADIPQTDLEVPQNLEKLHIQKTPSKLLFADDEVMSAFDGNVNDETAETLAGSNNLNLDPVPFKETEEYIEESLKYRDPSAENNPALSADEMINSDQTTLEQLNVLQDSKRNSEHQDVNTKENDASVVALVEIIEKVPDSTNEAIEDDKVDISKVTQSEATENTGMKIKESSELIPTMDHAQEAAETAADVIVGEAPETRYGEGENFKKLPNDSDLALDNSSEQGVENQRVNEQLDSTMDLEILQGINSYDKLEPVKSNPVIIGITASQDSQQVKTLNTESNVNEWQPHESTIDMKSHQLSDLNPNTAPSNEDEDANPAVYTSNENDGGSENSEVSAIIEVVEEIDNNQANPISLDSTAKEVSNELKIQSHQAKETADISGSAAPESNAADYVVRLIQEGVSHTNNIVGDVSYGTEANEENSGEAVKVIQSNEDTVKEQDSSTWFVRPNQDFNDNTNTNENKYVSEHEDSHDFALLSDDAPAEKTHSEWTVKVQPYEEGRPPVKVIGFTAADLNSDYSSPDFEAPDETLSSRTNNKVLQEAEENFFVIKDQVVQHPNPQVPDNARPEYLYDASPVPVDQVLPNEHSATILLDDGTIVKAAKENDRPLILSNTDNLKYRKVTRLIYIPNIRYDFVG